MQTYRVRPMGGAPILVTGSHRSGSTWVGKVLARHPAIAYLDEPFHVDHRPGTFRAKIDTWFQYVTEENEAPFRDAFRRTLAFRYGVLDELRAVRGWRDLARIPRDWGRFARARRRRCRPLVKDPIAFFAAPWFARRFGAQVVVLVRHPAAFASSLKRLDWQFDFRNWTSQPALMRDLLAGHRAEIEAFAREQPDVLEQAALLWKVVYSVADRWRSEHPDWSFVRHEDLSRSPLEGFSELFRSLGIELTDAIRGYLRETTSRENPAEAPEGTAHALRRDSAANVWSWKTRLTEDEAARLRERVEPVAGRFYDDGDW